MLVRRGVFRSVRLLQKAIGEYIETRDENAKPFGGTADADNILRRAAACALVPVPVPVAGLGICIIRPGSLAG